MKSILRLIVIAVMLMGLEVAATAQQPKKVFRIGLLSGGGSPPPGSPTVLDLGLRKLGYVEGQNITIEARYSNGQIGRLSELAVDLVRHPLDVIVAQSYPAAIAAKQATTTIPIVITGAGDPVATGLVASFARPGGQHHRCERVRRGAQRQTSRTIEGSLPQDGPVALLWNAADFGMTLRYRELERAAQALRVTVQASAVREPKDFESVFSEMLRKRPDALFVITDPLTQLNRKHVVELAAKHRLPAMYENAPYVEDGGLMAYGPSQAENLERAYITSTRFLEAQAPAICP